MSINQRADHTVITSVELREVKLLQHIGKGNLSRQLILQANIPIGIHQPTGRKSIGQLLVEEIIALQLNLPNLFSLLAGQRFGIIPISH